MDATPDHILPDLKAMDRDSAIRELLQHLVFVGAISSQSEDPLFHAIRSREEVMSTGVGFGLAIPHAVSEGVRKKVSILGMSKVGIDFSALDGKPVKKIHLTILPTDWRLETEV